MIAVQVGLGEGEVGLDHLHSGVTKQALEQVRIAAVPQVIRDKELAEAVDVHFLNVGTISNPSQRFSQVMAV